MATTWIKPTIDTKFHIDFDWWEKSGLDFRLYLRNQLCDDCKARFPSHRHTEMVDWIDPDTAEVKRTDALWQCLRTVCARKSDYINNNLPLASAVFRLFLANNNEPLSPAEMHNLIPWKLPDVILRTLTGGDTYMGIRPLHLVSRQ